MLRQTSAHACEARATGSRANCPTTDCKTGAIPATILEAIKMSVVEEMNRLAERYAELEGAKDVVEGLLYCMETLALPSGIEGSYHSEMEWYDTLKQIENEMQEIEDKIR
jgi:hypothetical protein